MPLPRSKIGNKAKDRDFRTLRTALNLPGAVVAGVDDHGNLNGLADDDHANYVHLTNARTVLAQHSFSPSSSQAPFLLGSNAQGQKVIGLNADELDGLNSSSAPGAAAAILATDSSGYLGLDHLRFGGMAHSGTEFITGKADDVFTFVHFEDTANSAFQLEINYTANTYWEIYAANHFTLRAGASLILEAKGSAWAGGVNLQSTNAYTIASGYHTKIAATWAPIAGTGTHSTLQVRPTINQTGTHTGDYKAIHIAPILTATNGTGYFITGEISAVDKFSVKDTGEAYLADSLGIGVAPSLPLHVRSTTTPQVRVESDGSNYAAFTVATDGHLNISVAGTDADMTLSPAGDLYLAPTDGDVKITGELGIGVLPSYPLHIRSTTTPQFRLEYDSDDYANFLVGSDGSLTLSTVATGSGHIHLIPEGDVLLAPAGGDTRIVGQVSIGDADFVPSYPLHIISTTDPQARIAYDASNLFQVTVASDGDVDLRTAGTSGTAKFRLAGNTFWVQNYSEENIGIWARAAAGYSRAIGFLTGSERRWVLSATGDAETGSNVGSDFKLDRYSDTDSLLGTTLRVIRSTGYAQFENRVGIDVAPAFPLHVMSIEATQFRLAYDGSNYTNFSIAGDGHLDISALGTDADMTLNPAGDLNLTLGGDIITAKNTTNANIWMVLSAAATKWRLFRTYTGASSRWAIGADIDAESGSDAGSNFDIRRYRDNGSVIGIALEIERATGYAKFENRVGIGVAPTAALNVLSTTTPQVKIAYDGDDYLTISVAGGGIATINCFDNDLVLIAGDDLVLTPTSTYTKITGEFQFQGAGTISTTSGNLSLEPAGDLDFNPTGSLLFSTSLIPTATDTYDVGSSIKLWRTGYFSELEALLFVENSIHVEAGWLIVGHGQGTIEANINNTTDTTVDLGIDETKISVNDFILFRAYLQVEYMKIVSQVGGAGTTVWNVTRDVDASGKNTWSEGSVFLVLGNTGDGRIELVASQNDAPRISLITQGATYNAQTEYFRAGNLRDSYNIGSVDTYGVGIGEYNSQSFIQITVAEGLEFFDDQSVQVAQLKGEIWTIGQVDASHKHIQITADTIQFMEDTTVYGSLSGTEWMIGNEASEKVVITASAVELQDGSDNVHMKLTGTTITVGQVGQEHVEVTNTELNFKNATVVRGSLSGDVWMLGAHDSEKVVITATAVQIQDDSDVVHLDLTGTTVTLGATGEEQLVLSSSSLTLKDLNAGQQLKISGNPATIVVGPPGTEHLEITASSVIMKDAADVTQVSLSGGVTPVLILGQVAASHKHVQVTADTLQFMENTTTYASLSGSTWVIGKAGAPQVTITSGSMTLTDINGTATITITDGEMAVGEIAGSHIYVESNLITFFEGATDFAALSATEWRLGRDGAYHRVEITPTGITFIDGGIVYGTLTADAWTIGRTGSYHQIVITDTALTFKDGGVTHGTLTSDKWTIGQLGFENIQITAASGIQFYNNTILQGYLSGTTWALGQSGDHGITITPTALTFYDNGSVFGTLTSTTWTLGKGTTTPQLVLTSTAVQLKDQAGLVQIELLGGASPYIYVGDNAGGEYVKVSAASGIEIFGGGTRTIWLDASGNATFGQVGANLGNMYWNNTSNRVEFRGGATGLTIEAYINTDGKIYCGGGDVQLGTGGIKIDCGTPAAYGTGSVNFYGGIFTTQIGAISGGYSTGGGGSRTIEMRSEAVSGNDMYVQLQSLGALWDTVALYSDDYITLKTNALCTVVYGRGLYVGSSVPSSNTPSAGILQVTSKIYINEVANAKNATGLTINQGTADDEIITLKSSEIDHEMTDQTETDTYGMIRKVSGLAGGIDIRGYGSGQYGVYIQAMVTSNNTSKSTAGIGATSVRSHYRSGAGITSLPSDGNAFTVGNYTSTVFIVDAEGTVHSLYQPTAGHIEDFDDYKDVALLHGFRASMVSAKHGLRKRFGEFIDYARPVLEEAGIVHYNDGAGETGPPFVSHQGLQILTIDALRQFHSQQTSINDNVHSRLARYERALLEAGIPLPQLEA
jgi:hypothetical protein